MGVREFAGVALGVWMFGSSSIATAKTPPADAGGADHDADHYKEGRENNFVIGLPFGLSNGGSAASLGLSLGYLYEMERFGIGFTAVQGILTGVN